MIGKLVIVRTYGAGVHVGTLKSRNGQEVSLSDARRLWRWRGANTLHEVAIHGVDEAYTRLSDPVEHIILTSAIELMLVSDTAKMSLTTSRWPT